MTTGEHNDTTRTNKKSHMNLSKWKQKHGKKVDGNKYNIKAHAIQWPHINMCMQNYMKKQTRYRMMIKIESNKPKKIAR